MTSRSVVDPFLLCRVPFTLVLLLPGASPFTAFVSMAGQCAHARKQSQSTLTTLAFDAHREPLPAIPSPLSPRKEEKNQRTSLAVFPLTPTSHCVFNPYSPSSSYTALRCGSERTSKACWSWAKRASAADLREGVRAWRSGWRMAVRGWW